MKTLLKVLLAAVLLTLLAAACSDEPEKDPLAADADAVRKVNSCEGCHADYEHLKAVYTPDPPSTGGHGCGGEAPHFEPYDRVYLDTDSEDYKAFKAGVHGKLDCTYCHNGTDGTSDKALAHSGEFVAKPSTIAKEKCASCHPDIVERTENSLHKNGWGQKSMVTQRAGHGTGPEKFNMLSDAVQEGYGDNCATCHGTCGECHITRPAAGGGGLLNSHKFNRTPDMRENCTACHSSRGGHAFYGIASGTKPDVHYENGFTCISCHTSDEVHGDGNYYDQRYKMPLLPECRDCHSDLTASNQFHQTHISDFNCNVCHSQDYNNCGSCHIGEEGARIASHQKFKIGMNPITDIKGFRMATLRESPMAPDSWDHYGLDVLPNFDVRPTYKYTTPHNIQKITTRTGNPETGEVYTTCYEGCHIIVEGDTVKNKEFYLFTEDLEPWEVEANKNTVVDGKLPASWGLN